ncbi:MAG: hypothetical protein ACLFNK_05605 [Candidatus Woesearchaeota archaeon]
MADIEYKGDREEILERIVRADTIVSDFDGTDVKTPLKRAAISYLSSPRTLMKRPGLIGWGIRAILKKAADGKDADSVLWEELSGILKEDTIDMIEKLYEDRCSKSEEVLEKSILPGVREIYASLPDAEKFYISRNFSHIIGLYASLTGVPEENIRTGEKKGALLENLIISNPDRRMYVIRGDSSSDDEVLDIAEFYKAKGAIDDYVGIAIGNSSHSRCEYADLLLGDDQSALADEIRTYKDSLMADSTRDARSEYPLPFV